MLATLQWPFRILVHALIKLLEALMCGRVAISIPTIFGDVPQLSSSFGLTPASRRQRCTRSEKLCESFRRDCGWPPRLVAAQGWRGCQVLLVIEYPMTIIHAILRRVERLFRHGSYYVDQEMQGEIMLSSKLISNAVA